jgi:hypothetical protein
MVRVRVRARVRASISISVSVSVSVGIRRHNSRRCLCVPQLGRLCLFVPASVVKIRFVLVCLLCPDKIR